MELKKLKRESAVNAVYQVLREAILDSLIKPGERLNVEELAEKLGVSLTPVRNAIQQLATEGLIEIRPRSGTFVASLSAEEIEETFEIRRALEDLAVEKAVFNITSAQMKTLKELAKSLRKPISNDEERKQHEHDNSEFHLTLVRASRNRRLIEMYEDLNAPIKIARIHAAENNWLSRLQAEQNEHEDILAALIKRDLPELKSALRKHIDRAKDALVLALENRDAQRSSLVEN